MNWLKSLYAQQTTPDEVVIFLLLGTILTLLVSFIAYAAIVIALSKWRMKKEYSTWSLLFPSPGRMRQYAAEYLLGTLTALLLGLTVSAKHNAVEAVLAQDISVIGRDVVRSALPFNSLEKAELIDEGVDPVQADRLVAWLDEGVVAPLSRSAEDLVRPLLMSGMVENASIVVRKAVDVYEESSGRIIDQRFIMAVAVGLLIAYVGWFGVQRSREMRDGAGSEPKYAQIMKRLSLPAVCIPLLLVSAVALEDTTRLENSVLGFASVPGPATDRRLSAVIARQAQAVTRGDLAVDARDLEQVNRSLEVVSQRLDVWSRDFARLQSRVDEAERRLAAAMDSFSSEAARSESLSESLARLNEALARIEAEARQSAANAERNTALVDQRMERLSAGFSSLNTRVGRLSQILDSLQEQIEAMSGESGVLLVQTNASGYTVVRSADNRVVARGEFIGIHILPPGQYRISAGGQTVNRSISADGGATARIMVSIIQ